ncbi:MAG: hydrogenase [Thermoplasmata archaeon]|nr:hydrogenase [Thermoplasmata archaeon]
MFGLNFDIKLGLDTDGGTWTALLFALMALVAFIIAYAIRSRGIKGHKEREHVGEPFYFGNIVPSSAWVKSGNVYWGFVKAMERYYRPVRGEHTGNANDYISWMVVAMTAIILMVVFL